MTDEEFLYDVYRYYQEWIKEQQEWAKEQEEAENNGD